MAQIQLTDGMELHPGEESILRTRPALPPKRGFSVLPTYKGGDLTTAG